MSLLRLRSLAAQARRLPKMMASVSLRRSSSIRESAVSRAREHVAKNGGKEVKPTGGIPIFDLDPPTQAKGDHSLLFPVMIATGIFGGLFGMYYRSKLSRRVQEHVVSVRESRCPLSPSECKLLETANSVSSERYLDLMGSVRSQIPSSSSSISHRELLEILHAGPPIQHLYLLERSLDTFPDPIHFFDVCGLLLHLVKCSNVVRVSMLYCLMAPEGEHLTTSNLIDCLKVLIRTFHVPTEFLYTLDKHFPIKHTLEISEEGLVNDAVKRYAVREKRRAEAYQKAEKKHKKNLDSLDRPCGALSPDDMTIEQFTDLMLHRPICLWGECFGDDEF